MVSAFSKLLIACLGCPCALDAAELVVDVRAGVGLVLAERREHLLVVGERARPVAEVEAHVGEAADGLVVGEIERVRVLVSLERAVVLAELREHLAEGVLQVMLLGALALAALRASMSASGSARAHSSRATYSLRAAAPRPRCPRRPAARARRPERPGRARPASRRAACRARRAAWPGRAGIRCRSALDPGSARRGPSPSCPWRSLAGRPAWVGVGRIEIEGHLVAILRLAAIAQLFVELAPDAVVHLDALLAVGREVRDARHVLDGAGRIVLLLVELGERLEGGMLLSSMSTMLRYVSIARSTSCTRPRRPGRSARAARSSSDDRASR
jgi:hypothetical protein